MGLLALLSFSVWPFYVARLLIVELVLALAWCELFGPQLNPDHWTVPESSLLRKKPALKDRFQPPARLEHHRLQVALADSTPSQHPQ